MSEMLGQAARKVLAVFPGPGVNCKVHNFKC